MERSGLEGLISYAADTGEGSVELDFEVENINKANVEANGTGSYGESWNLNLVQGTNIPTTITMTTPQATTFYKTTEGETTQVLTDVSAVYANTMLFKEQLKEILVNSEDNGAVGKLQIKNADTNAVLFEITENNIEEQEDLIDFTYSSNISKISIVLENINTQATTLTISHSKYVSGINTNYINNNTISRIESKLNLVAGTTNETYTKETYLLRTTKATFKIDNNNTTSETEVDNKNTLFVGAKNKVKLTIDLHTENKEYELYSNPSFVLLFPMDYVKTASMFDEANKVDLTITGGFELSEYAVQNIEALNAIAIAFSLDGTQINWADSAEKNAKLELNVNLDLTDEIPEEIKPIILYYKNNGLTQYEIDSTNEANITCGKLTQDINLKKAVSVELQNIESTGGVVEKTQENENENNNTSGDENEDNNTSEEETVKELEVKEGEYIDYILSVEVSKESELSDGKLTIKNILPEGIELAVGGDETYEIYDRDNVKEESIEVTDEDTGETSIVTLNQEQKINASSYTYNEETRELIIILNVDKTLPIVENKDIETGEVNSYSIGSITKDIRIVATVNADWEEEETSKEIKNKIDVITVNENIYASNEVSFKAIPTGKVEEDNDVTGEVTTSGGNANEAGISAYMKSSTSTWTDSYEVKNNQHITLSKIKKSPSIFCRERGGRQGELYSTSYSKYGNVIEKENNRYSYILSYPWEESENSGALTSQKIQTAIWKTGASGLCANNLYTGGSTLYNEAINYENYMTYVLKNNVKNSVNGDGASIHEGGLVGPFEINYYAEYGFGGITAVEAYAGLTKETANTKVNKTVNGKDIWGFVDANGKEIAKPDGENSFYIKIYDMTYFTDNNLFFVKLRLVFDSLKETFSEHYNLKGTGYYKYKYTPYCSSCQSIIDKAKAGSPGDKYIKYNGSYYKMYNSGKADNSTSGSAGYTVSGNYLIYYCAGAEYWKVFCVNCGGTVLGTINPSTTNLYAVRETHLDKYPGHKVKYSKVYARKYYCYTKISVGCGALSDYGYCGHTYNAYQSYDLQRLLQVQKRKIITTTDTAYIEFPVAVTIGGTVWEDGQTGVKPTKAADGKMDEENEAKVQQVKVALYRVSDGERVTENAYGKAIGTDGYLYTDSKGYYEFKDIKANSSGFYVKFEYDGVNYIATETGGDSVGEEKDYSTQKEIRTTFNDNFKTINSGKTGTGIKLNYKCFTEKVDDNTTQPVAKLLTVDPNEDDVPTNYPSKSDNILYMGEVAGSFKMTAISPVYKTTNKNVNLGIVKRGVDLNLLTDLVTADVKVNGETTVYTYDQIGKNGKVTLGEKLTSDQVKYNTEIDRSDYNYKIRRYGDIKVDASLTGDNLDKEKVKNVDIENLNIIATYKVLLSNNSTANAKVNSINYYYDANYTFINDSEYYSYEKYNSTGNKDLGSITITEDSNITTIGEHKYKKLIIRGLSSAELATLNGEEQNIITLKFSVNANSSTTLLETGDFMCIGEIRSYSTDQGYVDDDSAPSNVTRKDAGWFEDDTDKAGTLTIEVTDKPQREIRGFVFEDSKTVETTDSLKVETTDSLKDKDYTYSAGNGKYDSENKDETKVNGVIVQLVERVIMQTWTQGKITYTSDEKLAKDNGYTLLEPDEMPQAEYIWQETVSGSSIVRKISYDGETIETYNLNDYGISVERGEYAFTDFIPGVYIIRFIYGDGKTFEGIYQYKIKEEGEIITITDKQPYKNYKYSLESGESSEKYSILEEVAKYNGQAYKSTTDINYKEEWLPINRENLSVARDNEARRLETIIKTAEITGQEATATTTETDGKKQVTNLGKYDLEELWMCAETSKINVNVKFMNNSYGTAFENEGPGTYYLTSKNNSKKDDTPQKFENVNFGLEERAKNEIYLEKHIERLIVTLQNGTEVINVKVNLEEYYNSNGKKEISELDRIGISKGLSIVGAKKDVTEGFWHVDIDDEIIHGGKIELVYRYSVEVRGEQDYLSADLADIYTATDKDYLNELSNIITNDIKPARYWDETERNYYNISDYFIGEYLGSTYYTGILDLKDGTENRSSDSEVKPVTVKVLSIVDFVNHNLNFVKDGSEYMDKTTEDDISFPSGENYTYVILDSEGVEEPAMVNTILRSTEATKALEVGDIDYKYSAKFIYEGLSPTGVLEFPAYYAQVTSYITPTGRLIEGSTEYLPYAYSNILPGTYGVRPLEIDESWAEKLILVKPTGEDEMTKLILAITITAGVVIVAGGVFAIKKYVIR